jgi:hypothetical protein
MERYRFHADGSPNCWSWFAGISTWVVRHKATSILIALLFMLFLGFYMSPYSWPFVGILRGEPFYDGMPRSYWRREIIAREDPSQLLLWFRHWGLGNSASIHSGPVIDYQKEEALSVVFHLMRDRNPRVRAWSANYLWHYRRFNEEVFLALLDGAQDEDFRVRLLSLEAIGRYAARHKNNRAFKAEKAVPYILPCLTDNDPSVRGTAEDALKIINRDEALKRGV